MKEQSLFTDNYERVIFICLPYYCTLRVHLHKNGTIDKKKEDAYSNPGGAAGIQSSGWMIHQEQNY